MEPVVKPSDCLLAAAVASRPRVLLCGGNLVAGLAAEDALHR